MDRDPDPGVSKKCGSGESGSGFATLLDLQHWDVDWTEWLLLQEMCASIGVDPLASGKGFWSNMLDIGDFYYELAVQIVEVKIPFFPRCHKRDAKLCTVRRTLVEEYRPFIVSSLTSTLQCSVYGYLQTRTSTDSFLGSESIHFVVDPNTEFSRKEPVIMNSTGTNIGCTYSFNVLISVADPRHFGSDQWIRLRILLFSSLAFSTFALFLKDKKS
jgi:hypothetical protein